MIFLIIAGVFLVFAVILFSVLCTKNKIESIIAPIFCFIVSITMLFVSATFHQTPTVDTIEFLTERTLDSDENNVLISSSGVSTTLNLHKFFEDFDFKRINSEQFRIVESANYDEITLQLYGYKNNFWYSDVFSASYLYVLIIPAK